MSATEDALARSVIAIDGARRVGWAKAFSAQAVADEHARDSNMFRHDRDMYQRALSYLYGVQAGYIIRAPRRTRKGKVKATDVIWEQMQAQVDGFDTVLDPVVVAAGRRFGVALREADQAETQRMLKRVANRARSRDASEGADN